MPRLLNLGPNVFAGVFLLLLGGLAHRDVILQLFIVLVGP